MAAARAAGLPASPGYDPAHNAATSPVPDHSAGRCRSASTALLPALLPHLNQRTASFSGPGQHPAARSPRCCCRFPPSRCCSTGLARPTASAGGGNELLFKLRRIIRASLMPAGSHIFLHIWHFGSHYLFGGHHFVGCIRL